MSRFVLNVHIKSSVKVTVTGRLSQGHYAMPSGESNLGPCVRAKIVYVTWIVRLAELGYSTTARG